HSRSPSTSMVPELGRSRVIKSRKMVVLPDPLGPMIASFSPAATSRSSSRRTLTDPKDFDTRSNRTIASRPDAAMLGRVDSSSSAIAGLQAANEPGRGITHEQKEEPDFSHRLQVAERFRTNDLRLLQHLQDANR